MTASGAGVRDEVRSWVADNWDEQLTLREWWGRLAEAGLAFPHWPEGYGGRGWAPEESRIVGEELARAGAIGPPGGLGQMMGGPVVLEYGSDEQKQRWVKRLAAGEESWCQFFSEPGAGSDLASAQTRAVRDGDVWVVNGQKVWTSGARTADRGMLVARTHPDEPKHRGLSYFIIDVDQPGIEVRPLKQMNGQASFNEVFFTDAVVPDDRLIGEPGGGWMVAVATLAYERQGIGGRGGGMGAMSAAPGERNGMLDQTVADLLKRQRDAAADQAATMRLRSSSGIAGVAQQHGRTGDPLIRQRLAAMHAAAEAQRFSGLRARAAAQAGRLPGPEVSTAKLAGSLLGRQARDIGLAVLGAGGMLMDDDAPDGGAVAQMALSVQGGSIAGGTDEIQRNIIGERVLGLPKEPQVDRDIPFKDLKVGTQRD